MEAESNVPSTRAMRRRPVGTNPRNRGVKSLQWDHLLDGEVRPERDARTTVDDVAERVQALHAFGSL